ncbi:MAG TPA: glycosyltransferase family 2 protein, partial [Opitutaceae bacterium]|nr:glycosyltransferase family 2 protein [Opitutaceae bacterium]
IAVRCHVDAPANGAECSAIGFVCRGWAFAEGAAVRGVRLVTGGLSVEGPYGSSRPDVQAAFPGVPDDRVGWQLHAVFPPGEHEFAVEFLLENGEWVPGLRRRLRVAQPGRPRWMPGYENAELLPRQMPLHALHPPWPLRVDEFPQRASRTQPLPRLSIVTPNLNQGWALEECLDAVLASRGDAAAGHARFAAGHLEARPATPLDLEYIVQDGGSSDRSVDLIRRRHTAIDYWESRPDGGQTDALQRGFAKTTGGPRDVMAWINADDFYLPGALRFVAEYFARHPEVDVLYGHRLLVDRDGREIGRWFLPRHDPAVLRLYDLVPQETLFWRRRIWERVGGLRPEFGYATSWDLFLRFMAIGARIARVPYFLAAFRLHCAQKTRSQLATVGEQEIAQLHRRTFGRPLRQEELLSSRPLTRYLRRSAWIESLWRLGYRAG